MIENDENHMIILLDTGVTVNIGNLSYHLLVILQDSKMIGKYLQYRKGEE